jgi:rubrerythrin
MKNQTRPLAEFEYGLFMRHNQGQNSKRSRGRGRRNGGHNQVNFNRNTTFDSNGPEGRLRGNAQQLFEKYTALAHDANAAGERISAEAFAQFADHYYRIHQSIVQAAEQQRKAHDERQQSRRREGNGSGDDNLDEGVPAETSAEETDETKTEIAAEELSDEDAAMGVKKMVSAGRARKPRASKKTQASEDGDSQESEDPSEAVA